MLRTQEERIPQMGWALAIDVLEAEHRLIFPRVVVQKQNIGPFEPHLEVCRSIENECEIRPGKPAL